MEKRERKKRDGELEGYKSNVFMETIRQDNSTGIIIELTSIELKGQESTEELLKLAKKEMKEMRS